MASSNGVEPTNQRQCSSGTNSYSGSNSEAPIRTLYIRGFTPHWMNNINNHFGQFGKIETVARRFEDIQTYWCLVQFKREEDAKEALLRTGNKWNGCYVRAADPWHQPDHPLQLAPEQDSDSNISVALNDNCLQEIFKRLKLSSLTNVAGVCKKFNAQAKKTFALKHKHLDLTEQFYSHHDLIESALKHFGKDIQSLSIDAALFSEEADAIRIIDQNCGSKLKQIEFRNFRFQTDSVLLRPIFSQIEQLQLVGCAKSSKLGELMASCGELKSLSLSSCASEGDDNILRRTFPKLKQFAFTGRQLDDETFERFITRHPTLTKLSFEGVRLTLTPQLFLTIGRHGKHLQELKLIQVQFQDDAVNIGQLSSLKNLQLDIECSVVPLLSALVADEVPIECMEIQFNLQSDIDQAIKCISQLNRLKILKLKTGSRTRRITDEDVVKLVKYLPELQELDLRDIHDTNRFFSSYIFQSQLSTIGLRKMLVHANNLKLLKLHSIESIRIDVDDYKAMISTVRKRKEKVPLVIEIQGATDQVDVPAAVLAENRNTFNIELICFWNSFHSHLESSDCQF